MADTTNTLSGVGGFLQGLSSVMLPYVQQRAQLQAQKGVEKDRRARELVKDAVVKNPSLLTNPDYMGIIRQAMTGEPFDAEAALEMLATPIPQTENEKTTGAILKGVLADQQGEGGALEEAPTAPGSVPAAPGAPQGDPLAPPGFGQLATSMTGGSAAPMQFDNATAQAVYDEAIRQQVPPEIALAVAKAESDFNPSAVGPPTRTGDRARGTMQLMEVTAQRWGVDRNDPAQNIYGGVRNLKYLLGKYSDPRLAVAAYNAGEGNVDKYGGVPPFAETQDYVRKVDATMTPGATPATPTREPRPMKVAPGQALDRASRNLRSRKSRIGLNISSKGTMSLSIPGISVDEQRREDMLVAMDRLKADVPFDEAVQGLLPEEIKDLGVMVSGDAYALARQSFNEADSLTLATMAVGGANPDRLHPTLNEKIFGLEIAEAKQRQSKDINLGYVPAETAVKAAAKNVYDPDDFAKLRTSLGQDVTQPPTREDIQEVEDEIARRRDEQLRADLGTRAELTPNEEQALRIELGQDVTKPATKEERIELRGARRVLEARDARAKADAVEEARRRNRPTETELLATEERLLAPGAGVLLPPGAQPQDVNAAAPSPQAAVPSPQATGSPDVNAPSPTPSATPGAPPAAALGAMSPDQLRTLRLAKIRNANAAAQEKAQAEQKAKAQAKRDAPLGKDRSGWFDPTTGRPFPGGTTYGQAIDAGGIFLSDEDRKFMSQLDTAIRTINSFEKEIFKIVKGDNPGANALRMKGARLYADTTVLDQFEGRIGTLVETQGESSGRLSDQDIVRGRYLVGLRKEGIFGGLFEGYMKESQVREALDGLRDSLKERRSWLGLDAPPEGAPGPRATSTPGPAPTAAAGAGAFTTSSGKRIQLRP